MSLPKTMALNQYMGISIIFFQLNCFVKYVVLHVTNAAVPDMVVLGDGKSVLVKSVTPPPKPITTKHVSFYNQEFHNKKKTSQ
jgi:hypothetical protein